jgi:hypothetical protein
VRFPSHHATIRACLLETAHPCILGRFAG